MGCRHGQNAAHAHGPRLRRDRGPFQPRRQDDPERRRRQADQGMGCRHGPAAPHLHRAHRHHYRSRFFQGWQKVRVGQRGRTVKIWDTASGQPLLTLADHHSIVAAVAFSPDDKQVAVGNVDQTISLFDAATGKRQARSPAHAIAVSGLSDSPDGRWLASCGADQRARVGRAPLRDAIPSPWSATPGLSVPSPLRRQQAPGLHGQRSDRQAVENRQRVPARRRRRTGAISTG